MKRPKSRNPAIAIAYLRVSTDEQQLGPEAQRAAIERWAAARGVRVVSWHADQGISGGATYEQRPALQAAFAALREHDAGVFVVAKRDRIARDVMIAAMVERLAEREGATVMSAAGEGEGGADDPGALLMRRMIDVFAEYERALIRSRTKAALGVKKARGERVGSVPFGFRVSADGKTLAPCDAEQAAIERARTLRESGLSLRAVARALASEGVLSRSGKALCLATVDSVTRSRA
jgi:DNA invertase Pin-like site-specific DNA recombinase